MISIASSSNATGTPAVVIAKPSGLQVGDIMLSIISGNFSDITSFPSGWDTVGSNNLNYNRVTVYKKAATSDDVSTSTFSWSINGKGQGIIYRIPQANFSSIQISTTSLTPTEVNNAVILVGMSGDNDGDSCSFSGYSVTGGVSPTFYEDYDYCTIDGSYYAALATASSIYSSLSPITSFNVTADNSPDETSRFMILVAGIDKPIVTTQAVTSIASTTAVGNGNITNIGSENAYQQGMAYVKGNSGDITFYPIPDQSFETGVWSGVGTITKSTTQKKYGSSSMKVTWASGTYAVAGKTFFDTSLRNKFITFGAWVWSDTPNIASLIINEDYSGGYIPSTSTFHSGNSTWEWLSCSILTDSVLTSLTLQCYNGAVSSTPNVYYDGAVCMVSPTEPNLALGKIVTPSPTLTVPSGSISLVTDGDILSTNYFGEGSGILNYVQVDLGTSQLINKITVWHYYADSRTYHSTKTQVSEDGITWTTIFDSAVSGEYAESINGKTTIFTLTEVRYIRDYINGSTANASNHWVEIKAFNTNNLTFESGSFGTGAFTTNLTGLTRATDYRVSAFASNQDGTSYGSTVGFKTLAVLPTVSTVGVNSITQSSLIATGNLTDNGGETTERGFVWATTLNPTIADNKVIVTGGLGAYNTLISGFTANTDYHIRAYATNSIGTSYGTDIAFSTLSSGPMVKRRVSFLSKAQSLTIQLSNNAVDETFTVLQFAVVGEKQEKKTFTPNSIISIN